MSESDEKRVSLNLALTGYADHRVDLYRQAASELRARSSGHTRYVLDIFGPDLIGSLAFAIDPFKQFHNTVNLVALLTDGGDVVRIRRKISVPSKTRKLESKVTVVYHGYGNNPQGPIFSYVYTGPITTTTTRTDSRSPQNAVYAISRDTTKRTRPAKKSQGEFEHFTPTFRSGETSHGFLLSDSLTYNSVGTGQRVKTRTQTYSKSVGPEFVCSDANIQTFLPVIRARAAAEMQKHVYGMLDRVQPAYRNYDLVRQIAELKDLPQTILGSLQIWRSFERFVGTNLFRDLQHIAGSWRDPDLLRYYSSTLGRSTGFRYDELLTLDQNAGQAFLTFKFGWESIVRGVEQFLPSPARIAKQINFLIERVGKDQSFRTKKTWTEKETSTPTLSFNYLRSEDPYNGSSIKTDGVRKVELRLMANFSIRFPDIEIPKLRRQLYLRKIGANPTPSDIYNLIPWTWLIDWFTGAGDYVSLMDSIRADQSLINYGFMTYREESTITGSIQGRATTTVSRSIDGVNTSYQRYSVLSHNCKLKWVYHLRRSIPSLTNVRSYWGSGLNSNQTAIIGALISAKNGSRGVRVAS